MARFSESAFLSKANAAQLFQDRTEKHYPVILLQHDQHLRIDPGNYVCFPHLFDDAYHLQFDDFHHEDDRIYRFVTEQHRDQISYTGSVPPAFGLAFRNDYTFGEKVARICTLDEQLISVEENGHQKKFKEDVSFAEPEFFQIFNFPIVAGYHKNILVVLASVMLIFTAYSL